MPGLVVVAALIRRGKEVLLARRRPGDEQGGLWEFPGGAVEAGESLPECLARELAEELGIEVEVGKEVAAVTHSYGALTIELHLLEAEIRRGEPRPLGCAEVRWVAPEELAGLRLAPADGKLVGLLNRAGKLAGGDG
ncbi:(deoxy)nucleoside triphosphate pyrophosphohydrolase [Candidatus Bipolaricaulota bacterium]|nr:(deoxy)nucleoside triphosphate pyrophosphohydrolase [Candidatus Bipolaricaulota bacterium]